MSDRDDQLDHVRTTAKMMALGLDELADLALAAAEGDTSTPTVGEFHHRVIEVESLKAGWVKRKGLHGRFVTEFADRKLTRVTATDVELYAAKAKQAAVERHAARHQRLKHQPEYTSAGTRDGTGAQRSAIEAARAFFNVAIKDGLLRDNPARLVKLPPRKPAQARAANDAQLAELWEAVISGGDDPELDALIVWFHLETGARRGGGVSLTRADLGLTNRETRLHEKGGTVVDQPVSMRLLRALDLHSRSRGSSTPDGPVFVQKRRASDGSPRGITKSRYGTLTRRIRREVPWARERGWHPHDLRRTAITAIERLSGSTAVARLFARHAAMSTTDGYVPATPEEVRAAVDIWAGGHEHE